MPRVRLKINQSAADGWLAILSTDFPDDEFRVLASHPADGGLLGIVEVTTPNADAIVRRFDDAPDIDSYEILHSDQQLRLIRYVIPMPASYRAALASRNLPTFPLLVRDGWIFTEMTASHERLSQFTDELEDAGIPYEILSLTQSYDSIDLLTARQQEFITEAVERGYYDSPRGCTLTELAETFEVNSSAASGVLHRAEGRIITEFVADSTT